MEFTVDLQADEYQQAMLWHQFRETPLKRMNEGIAWAVLVLTPLTVIMLLIIAPDALSFWFWPVAIVAVLYALYSTLMIRYQIRTQAKALLAAKPALRQTHYHVHEKGIKLTGEGTEKPLFLPWKEIARIHETKTLFLIFADTDTLLIVPKRSLPDLSQFRTLLPLP